MRIHGGTQLILSPEEAAQQKLQGDWREVEVALWLFAKQLGTEIADTSGSPVAPIAVLL